MKAERSVQLALLDVQALDSELTQLAHKQKNLPEHAEIAALDTQLAEFNSRRVAAETEVGDLERALKKQEQEVELVQTRRARDEDRLNSGAVTNPKDLTSLQNEITALERRISKLEDDELELMESLEAARAVAGEVGGLIAEAQSKRDEFAAARDQQITEFDAKRETISADRQTVFPRLTDEVAALYQKLADQHGGLAVGALERGRCGGCRLELNGSDLREVLAKPADDIVRCPECSRILVRTLDSDS